MSGAVFCLSRSVAEKCTEIYFVVMKVFVEPMTIYCKETWSLNHENKRKIEMS